MVVLESPTGASVAAAATPMVIDSATPARSSLKIVPKRFINLHSWLGPLAAKSLKEFMVGQK